MKPLIIVESYTKTKTIAKYLNNQYNVICSLGHINNLPTKELGINTDIWKAIYVDTNKKIIENIRENAKNASAIYIASDPDMEGEAIAHHIYNYIKHVSCPIHRIRFHEITKKAISDALNNPQQIDKDMVDAQESRRFVDRLVGYKLSPLLWNKLSDNTLSVGRVQSVALLMCIQMQNKIEQHDNSVYWIIQGLYVPHDTEFKLYHNNTIFKTTDKQLLYTLLQQFTFDKNFTITFKDSVSQESPGAPYTTTSMQQDAYNKLRFSSKKTMQIAQQLYENGLITYMRTDSTNISDTFKHHIISYISEKYGAEYCKFRTYKNKIANAQEAHEAIRITNINSLTTNLSDDHNKLYEMIWKRTIACQMINAEYHNIDVCIKYINMHSDHFFIHKKALLTKAGYLIVYNTIPTITPDAYKENMKNLKAKEFNCIATIDTPPSLYNEIQLIKALEKEGIGRPSTYAGIIDKLLSKHYVIKGKNPQQSIDVHNIHKNKDGTSELPNKLNIGGKQKDLLLPTKLGKDVIDYLQNIVPFLLDIQFTATMEDSLDKICQKQMTKKDLLDNFYKNYLQPVVEANTPSQSCNIPNKNSNTKSGIIQTKYGYCYYHASNKRYTNIESYLKWKKINVEELQDKDIRFLKSLPKKLDDGTELHIGPYGLYIKDKNKNCRLDKNKWLDFI